MADTGVVALDRDPLIGPDPTWEMLPVEDRQQWLADIEDFPPPPLLLELLTGDLNFDSYDPRRLAEKVAHDPVLIGRLLSRANSAAFGLREPITSLRQAVVHLGFNLVRSTILRYQVDLSAARLRGITRDHIMYIQRSTDQGAVIAYNWALGLKLADPAGIATRCLLGRLGTFLLARRFPKEFDHFFAAGHEPQRLNFEANHFGVTSRTLTFKVAQAWRLPETLQRDLFHLWTPLFAEVRVAEDAVACAAIAMSFDPPHHLDDIQKWLSLRVHQRLRENLEAYGALKRLPEVVESDSYAREMSALVD
jgi:HD-like signal output (HDOD) protein